MLFVSSQSSSTPIDVISYHSNQLSILLPRICGQNILNSLEKKNITTIGDAITKYVLFIIFFSHKKKSKIL